MPVFRLEGASGSILLIFIGYSVPVGCGSDLAVQVDRGIPWKGDGEIQLNSYAWNWFEYSRRYWPGGGKGGIENGRFR
jgi:hypothetical protein